MGFVGLRDYASVVALLQRLRGSVGESLSAFELISPEFYHLATVELPLRAPLKPVHGMYALVELMGGDQAGDEARLAQVIEAAMEAGTVEDAVLTRSQQENDALWRIRDSIGEFSKTSFWPQVPFDISIPTAEIGRFMPECRARLLARWPEARTVYFGHIADSNLHLSVRVEENPLPIHALDEVVYGCVREWGGSISAEHGIGILKRDFLSYSRSDAEIGLMQTLKAALDPKGILNPGKVI
jgi:FAD/FMN-containing dehydrogenase